MISQCGASRVMMQMTDDGWCGLSLNAEVPLSSSASRGLVTSTVWSLSFSVRHNVLTTLHQSTRQRASSVCSREQREKQAISVHIPFKTSDCFGWFASNDSILLLRSQVTPRWSENYKVKVHIRLLNDCSYKVKKDAWIQSFTFNSAALQGSLSSFSPP